MARILIVEDEPSSSRALELFFRGAGYEVSMAADADEAIAAASDVRPHLLVTDVLLKSAKDGLDVAADLKADDPSLQIVVMTGLPHSEIERRVSRVTDLPICFKPIRLARLRDLVDQALARQPDLE